MIDIHSHIMFDVDDGSPDLDTSLDYLKFMSEEGIKGVILTPHYMKGFYDNTAEIQNVKFQILKDAVQRENINIELYRGAEIFLSEDIHLDVIKENLTLNNTNYILMETSMNGFPNGLLDIYYILVKQGYKPILAHPERYTEFINNPYAVEDLIHRNIYMQINTGSLLGGYGKKIQDTAWEMIYNGYAHFLGSDTHCHTQDYSYVDAVEAIRSETNDHTAKLLSEINPMKMLKNEKVNYFGAERFKKQPEAKKSLFKKLFGL